MPPVQIKDEIFWVGAVDWNLRDFHGYSTEQGTTYNAYLVLDEKITLFDTVKKEFKSELLHHLRALVDPKKIDYLVVNHVEMDHTGALPDIIEATRPEKIFCSPKGKEALLEHYHRPDWPLVAVENGSELRLGKRTVKFLETRMLHWPDSMFSYLAEDRLLISSDAFGQHYATSERFDDQVDFPELMLQARKYYANILLPYSNLVQKLLAEVKKMGLPIDMIAGDHGLIWRRHLDKILAAYDEWSRQEPLKKAVIAYASMWGSTETMARAVADGLIQEGVSVKLMNLKFNHRSDVVAELLDAHALVIGSATLNNGILPPMADLLAYLKGLRPQHKIGAAFGSYGWSGEAVKIMSAALAEMKVEVVDPGVRAKYVPDHDALQPCVELGRRLGRRLQGRAEP
jgi:flavorubredoxin